MWRTLWRSIDRFSLQYFKYIINELRVIKVVDKLNRELVVDLLQSIVEIVTYGDRHDPSIFECFMEYQVLAEFVRVLKISRNSIIEAPLLQYLSIMIQNMDSEYAIYYCLSNDYINSIITHQYEFDGGDLAPYYVSFLRAVSGKINRDTLCLLVKVHEDVVVSFPLYTEALKFAHHGEKMIQTAIRALTLNIYNVSDDMVHQFVTSSPASAYFSDLVLSLRKQCFHLDDLVHATKVTCIQERRNELLLETDKILDDLYYFKDILCVGDSCLSNVVTQNLLSLLVCPILLPFMHLSQSSETCLSPITSLYIVSRLLQVIGGKHMVNFVASAVLYPYISSSMRDATEGSKTDCINQANSFANNLHEMDKMLSSESESAENFRRNNLLGHLSNYMPSKSHLVSFCSDVIHKERSGILSYIFSENNSLMLASLMLLLVVAENTDLDYQLAAMIGLTQTKTRVQKTYDFSASKEEDESIFGRHLHEILNALLEVLERKPSVSVLVQQHTGWFLRKLLVFQDKKLNGPDFHLFNVKTSYEQSCEILRKELNGCCFDHIPDTLRNEWASYKTALEEPSQSKDPFFALELACHQHTHTGVTTSALACQSMVNAVKVFVLHLQLKAFFFNGDPFENPMINLKSSSLAISGRTYASDLSSASFGSEVPLGSGIPCKIAFSKVGIRDIYMIPVARGISGKLLLVEKHPLHSKRGIVIAIAPLAGLSPKVDESHPTWLHLQIREFDPRFDTNKTGGHHSSTSDHLADGRWTLGFPSTEACEVARLLILEEISKQRSSVESLLSALLQGSSRNMPDNQGSEAFIQEVLR
ncbi:protein TRANSPARENT TESTA 9-like isoform X3 [Cornus florida]|uniref:protein TRANSPARENT TESTA 9-like isoform X3 n=1 Tax=Cornus florida TaxID=4283 RepID=UPI002897D298|nr:protein TRANSPARENT TESTA 9-like isoform X3 [Cornus florida]